MNFWIPFFILTQLFFSHSWAKEIKFYNAQAGMEMKLISLNNPSSLSLTGDEVDRLDVVPTVPAASKSPRLYSWTPKGGVHRFVDSECHYKNFPAIFSGLNIHTQGRRFKEFLAKCEYQYRISSSTRPLVRFTLLFYNQGWSGKIYKVRVTMDDGRILQGFLGLKGDAKARPLIITTCGLFCDSTSSQTGSEHLMQLFDEGPFHVLSLGSISGSDYGKDNGMIGLGGFDEGQLLYNLARLVQSKESTLAPSISKVHLIGISLAAHSVLYASLYGSLNPMPDGRWPFDSALITCPVVDLEKSMRYLYGRSFVGRVTKALTVRELKKIYTYVPLLKHIIKWEDISNSKVYEIVVDSAVETYRRRTLAKPWTLKPFKNATISNREDFFRLNNILDYTHLIKIPVFALASKDDLIVRYSDNGALLKRQVEAGSGGTITVVPLAQGNHCSHSAAYGWGFGGSLLRNYFLSRSPEVKNEKPARIVSIRKYVEGRRKWRYAKPRPGEQNVGYRWQFKKGWSYANLTLIKFSALRTPWGQSSCENKNPRQAPRHCYQIHNFKIPLSVLIPSSPYLKSYGQARWMTRMANNHWKLVGRENSPYLGSRQAPSRVEIPSVR